MAAKAYDVIRATSSHQWQAAQYFDVMRAKYEDSEFQRNTVMFFTVGGRYTGHHIISKQYCSHLVIFNEPGDYNHVCF